MSKTLKLGVAQLAISPDINSNRHRLAQAVRQLAEQGAQIVILSELHDTPYFCQEENVDNFDYAQPIPGAATSFYSALARDSGVVLVSSLFERRAPGLYHNTAVVFERDGNVAGSFRKMHIPDDPGYYEKFYFTPGDLGFRPIQTSVGRLGVQVCWDQWYPEGARLMAMAGADILIYPTAIGYDDRDTADEQARQREAWTTIQRSHAVANGIPVVSVNRTGREPSPTGQGDGIQFWGSSFVCGPQGELIWQAPEREESVHVIEIDMERSEQVRRWWPFLRDRRIDAYNEITQRFL